MMRRKYFGAALLIAAALASFGAYRVPLPTELYSGSPNACRDDTAVSVEFGEGGQILAIGDMGDRVAALQARLIELGFFRGEADGVYGLETAEAVRRYQAEAGISVSGEAGVMTLHRLGLDFEGGGDASEPLMRLASAVEGEMAREGLCARVAYAAILLRRGGVISGTGEAPSPLSIAAARAALMGMDIMPRAFDIGARAEGNMYIKIGKACFYER